MDSSFSDTDSSTVTDEREIIYYSGPKKSNPTDTGKSPTPASTVFFNILPDNLRAPHTKSTETSEFRSADASTTTSDLDVTAFGLLISRLRKLKSYNLRIVQRGVDDLRVTPTRLVIFQGQHHANTPRNTQLVTHNGYTVAYMGNYYFESAQRLLISPADHWRDLCRQRRRRFLRALKKVADMPVDDYALDQLISVLRKYLVAPDTFIAEAYYSMMLN